MTTLTIRGAHAHNLQHIDVELASGQLIVFRGPSGSGKSSLALDVLHAESRRRLLEVLRVPGSGDGCLPGAPVDHIQGLPPTIAVAPDDSTRPDQPLAEMTDLGSVLRSLMAQRGVLLDPHTQQPLKAWNTTGIATELARLPVGSRLTIGAPLPPSDHPDRLLRELRRSGFARVRLGQRLTRLDDIERLPEGIAVELIVDRIKWGRERMERLTEAIDTAWKAGHGLVRIDTGDAKPPLEYSRLRIGTDGTQWPAATPEHFDPRRPEGQCPHCNGRGCGHCDETGYGPLARHTQWNGQTIHTLRRLSLAALADWLSPLRPLPDRFTALVHTFVALGLGHLSLGQSQRTLGRGEWRRAALGRAIHLAEPPNLLILDEPLSGLGPAQVARVLEVLKGVLARGSSVLVIEHRPEVLPLAGQVVDFGPGSGPDGGRLVAPPPERSTTAWGAPTPRSHPSAARWTAHHPRIRQSLPVRPDIWTVLTGPSGAGSTCLAVHALAGHFAGRTSNEACTVQGPEPRLIEPTLLAGVGNPRSCVATAAGIWTRLRTLLAATRTARVRGLGSDAFTFNRATGWCPECEGRGALLQRFGPLPPVRSRCPTCNGGRLRPDLNEVRWKGHGPRDLLNMHLSTARKLFSANPQLAPVLEALEAVGLGHLPLGRATGSLSSGERRRFGIALAMARLRAADRDPRPTLVVLDQPDAGLDDATAHRVAEWLATSIAGRGTLLTVAHHPALLAAADAVVVLGP